MNGVDYVRVFVDEQGRFGNGLAVVRDGRAYTDQEALALAALTGTSETVFVDDAPKGRLRIFVPRARVPFAGHPLVGTAWYLARCGYAVTQLHPDAGPVSVTATDTNASVRARSGQGVPWNLIRVEDPGAVDLADGSGAQRHDYVWAWEDRGRGWVRARAFASLSGTPEDEATGGAALQLASQLGRSLRIRQGRGSIITVEPDGDQWLLSGRVAPGGQSVP